MGSFKDVAPNANKQSLHFIYFYFQPTPCNPTMAESLSPSDPMAACLPPRPVTMASVLIALHVLLCSPFQDLPRLWCVSFPVLVIILTTTAYLSNPSTVRQKLEPQLQTWASWSLVPNSGGWKEFCFLREGSCCKLYHGN